MTSIGLLEKKMNRDEDGEVLADGVRRRKVDNEPDQVRITHA